MVVRTTRCHRGMKRRKPPHRQMTEEIGDPDLVPRLAVALEVYRKAALHDGPLVGGVAEVDVACGNLSPFFNKVAVGEYGGALVRGLLYRAGVTLFGRASAQQAREASGVGANTASA